MHLSDEAIEEFHKLWEQEFGETISKGEAEVRASEIAMLYEKLYLSGAGLKKQEDLAGEVIPPKTSA